MMQPQMNPELARQRAHIAAVRARIHAGAVPDPGIDLRRRVDPPETRYVMVTGPQPNAHVAAWRRVERSRGPMGVRPSDVLDVVAEVCGLLSTELLAPCNRPRVARARHLIWYLCRTHSVRSLKGIGMPLNRDHYAVLHGVNVTRQRVEQNDPEVIDRLRECRCRLGLT